jgi:hypothetical protein
MAYLDRVREQAAGPQHGNVRIQAAHQLHRGPVVHEEPEAAAHCDCNSFGLTGVELYLARLTLARIFLSLKDEAKTNSLVVGTAGRHAVPLPSANVLMCKAQGSWASFPGTCDMYRGRRNSDAGSVSSESSE